MHISPSYGVLLLINASQEILVIRRINTPFCNGWYALPGDTIRPGESAIHTALRQLQDSFGLNLSANDLSCVLVMHRKCNESEFFMCVFRAHVNSTDLHNNEPHRYDDMQWCAADALPDTMVSAHRYAIECIEHKLTYAQHGW